MSELKYLIFFVVLIVGVPVGYFMSQRFPLIEKVVFFLFLFFTCEMVDINFVSMEDYRGTSKGFEFGMVDISMYILAALVFKRRFQLPIVWLPPGSIIYFTYFICSAISIIHSHVFIYSAFELTKMVRMYLYFWIAFNYIRHEDQLETLAKCLGIIIVYIFLSVFKQKYLLGMFQNMGPFPHQNSLTMYMAFLGAFSFSRVLNKKQANPYLWLVIFGMCAFCVLATLSRAGLALFAFNCAIVFVISLMLRDREQKQVKKRKIVLVIILPMIAAAGLYKAADSIIERFTTAPENSKLTRIYLAQAAVKMANENVFGVGLNNFAHKINDPYPYGAHIPSEISRDESKRGLVETAYLMIAAETGWLNLGIFAVFLFYFYFKNLINIFKLKDRQQRYLAVALTGCLSQIYIQTTLEWVLKQTNNFYQLMLMFALIALISRVIRNDSKEPKTIAEDSEKYTYKRGANCVTTI